MTQFEVPLTISPNNGAGSTVIDNPYKMKLMDSYGNVNHFADHPEVVPTLFMTLNVIYINN